MTEHAYEPLHETAFRATPLTIGPWSPEHQHAGPPSALLLRAVERAAAPHGLTHIARLTVNLPRPIPVGEVQITVKVDHQGRSAAHFSGQMLAGGKPVALFTAVAQAEADLPIPDATPGHPPPHAPRAFEDSTPAPMGFSGNFGYAKLMETRVASGAFHKGPCAVWFRPRFPLVAGEPWSPYALIPAAADSGNGISAALDFARYSFVNCDLTINLFRRPVGEAVCVDARSWFAANGCGLAESALYDQRGLIGRASQSLAVRART